MITISHLTKQFGRVEVLRGIDLRIVCGRIVGLVGPNGAGKTTLIKTLLGLTHADAGEIRISRSSSPISTGSRPAVRESPSKKQATHHDETDDFRTVRPPRRA